MRSEEYKALIMYRLEQAFEALKDAEFLLESHRYRAAANRLYYACFYAALASLLTRQLQYTKHSAVIAFFDREFIRSGVLPKDYSKTLHRVFNERQQDDYMPFVEVDPDELGRLFSDARSMVNGISGYIAEHP